MDAIEQIDDPGMEGMPGNDPAPAADIGDGGDGINMMHLARSATTKAGVTPYPEQPATDAARYPTTSAPGPDRAQNGWRRGYQYQNPVDAVSALRNASSFDEFNAVVDANSHWLTNKWFNQQVHQASTYVVEAQKTKQASERVAATTYLNSESERQKREVLKGNLETLRKIAPLDRAFVATMYDKLGQKDGNGNVISGLTLAPLIEARASELGLTGGGTTAFEKNTTFTQGLLQEVANLKDKAKAARDAGDEEGAASLEAQAKIKQDSIPQTPSQKESAISERQKLKAESDRELAKTRLGHQMQLKTVSVLASQVSDLTHQIRAAEKPDSGINPTTLTNMRKDLRAKQTDLETRLSGAAQEAPAASPQPATAPKEGDVVKGYIFKGGDPSDKNNWQLQ